MDQAGKQVAGVIDLDYGSHVAGDGSVVADEGEAISHKRRDGEAQQGRNGDENQHDGRELVMFLEAYCFKNIIEDRAE